MGNLVRFPITNVEGDLVAQYRILRKPYMPASN